MLDRLLDSFERKYDKPKKRFRKGLYREVGRFVIGQSSPWSKETTWMHVGIPDDPNEKKKLGPVMSLLNEWHFIEEVQGAEKWQRVEESIQFLRKLLEEPPNP